MVLEIDLMQFSLNCKFEGLADVKTLRMEHREGGEAPNLAHARLHEFRGRQLPGFRLCSHGLFHNLGLIWRSLGSPHQRVQIVAVAAEMQFWPETHVSEKCVSPQNCVLGGSQLHISAVAILFLHNC